MGPSSPRSRLHQFLVDIKARWCSDGSGYSDSIKIIMGTTFAVLLLLTLVSAHHAFSVKDSDEHVLHKRAPQGFRDSFSLEEIVDNVFTAESWNGTWVSDTEYAYRNPEGGLALLSVVSGQSRTIVPASVMSGSARVFRFWVSADLKFVLLAMRPQKLFRHSFIAIYDIYNIATGERTKLQPSKEILESLRPPGGPPGGGPGGGGPGNGPPPGPPQGGPGGPGGGPGGPGGAPRGPPQLPLMYAEWAPTGSGIAYVFSNNIFYRRDPTSEDVTITESGMIFFPSSSALCSDVPLDSCNSASARKKALHLIFMRVRRRCSYC